MVKNIDIFRSLIIRPRWAFKEFPTGNYDSVHGKDMHNQTALTNCNCNKMFNDCLEYIMDGLAFRNTYLSSENSAENIYEDFNWKIKSLSNNSDSQLTYIRKKCA